MVLTTTNSIEGKTISNYLGIVTGSTYASTMGAKGMSFKDMFSTKKTYAIYEKSLEEAKEDAFQKLKANASKMNANAIVGISIDIETVPTSMISMVSIVGTAVVME